MALNLILKAALADCSIQDPTLVYLSGTAKLCCCYCCFGGVSDSFHIKSTNSSVLLKVVSSLQTNQRPRRSWSTSNVIA